MKYPNYRIITDGNKYKIQRMAWTDVHELSSESLATETLNDLANFDKERGLDINGSDLWVVVEL